MLIDRPEHSPRGEHPWTIPATGLSRVPFPACIPLFLHEAESMEVGGEASNAVDIADALGMVIKVIELSSIAGCRK